MANREAGGLFESLKDGLQEGIDFFRGEIDLRVTALPEPPPEVTAEGLAALRRRTELSPSAFARLLNVSTRTVQSWERGRRRPAQATLRLIQVLAEEPASVFQAAGLPWPSPGKDSRPPGGKAKPAPR